MEIELLCEQLERELSGRRGMVSDKVDLSECRRLIRAIREKMSPLLQSVNGVVAERKTILTNADTVAKNVLSAAEQKAVQIVSSSEIVRRAQTESRKILDQTYVRCDQLVLKTKKNIDDTLLLAEEKLRDALQKIGEYRYAVKSIIIEAGEKES